MKKKYLKGLIGVVSSAVLISSISTAIPSKASAATTEYINNAEYELNEFLSIPTLDNIRLDVNHLNNESSEIETDTYQSLKQAPTLADFESFEDIPQELWEPNYYSEEEIIHLPESYLDPYHPDAIDQVETYALSGALAGIYTIPGIGQITITVTGALIVGGAVIAAGSWIYNEVSAYFSKKAAKDAADKIPNDLKSDDMTVDLGKFKNKFGKTAKQTTASPPFTNGKWRLEKDEAGHIGYNGEKKAWKVWKKGASKRTASLDKKGNVIDE